MILLGIFVWDNASEMTQRYSTIRHLPKDSPINFSRTLKQTSTNSGIHRNFEKPPKFSIVFFFTKVSTQIILRISNPPAILNKNLGNVSENYRKTFKNCP